MSRHIYTLKKPASWMDSVWREALPLGNGLTGVLIPGFIGKEKIHFNRHDLWEGGRDGEIPDISDTFREMRKMIDRGDYVAANQNNMRTALWDKGYPGCLDCAEPMGWLHMDYEPTAAFKHYRRGVNMRTGEAFVEFTVNGRKFRRDAFVSRDCDVTVVRMTADEPFTARYDFTLYQETVESVTTEKSIYRVSKDARSAVNMVFVGDFSSQVCGDSVSVTGKDYLLLIRCASLGSDVSLDAAMGQDYDELLKKHMAQHTTLYDAVTIDFADEKAHEATNEELLAEAYDDQASPALLERVWRFGRYLFISGAAEDGIPIPLYGRWHGADHLVWTQFVANENVEMTYWHTMAGGLSYAIPALIRYYTKHVDRYRECARRMFGMQGIWVCTYTTPNVFGVGEMHAIVANWISCAGWLSRHFWEYYVYTLDEKMLREEILPFMYEAALFYRDYVVEEHDAIRIYPSVSPENGPSRIRGEVCNAGGPVFENATMDFAIMKELLTNLLAGMSVTGMYTEDADSFRELLAKIPPYMINEDGAIKEWMHPDFEDQYYHRHLSHIYPAFPGTEITAYNDPELFEAFKRAVMLRKLGAQTGWSLAHMASIYARMGEGELCADCLDTMQKSVVMDTLFTTHNDWRNMGTTWYLNGEAPMCLDAVFGTVNAIQEMLFCWQKEALSILPALPGRLDRGSVRGLAFPEGTLDIAWDAAGKVTVTVRATRDLDTGILVRGIVKGRVTLAAGQTRTMVF